MPRSLPPLLLCAVFVLLGGLWIDFPGLQADEALLASAVYAPAHVERSMWALGWKIPLMQMAYLGSLKTWLHAVVFWLFGPSVASIRYLALALGAAFLWCTFQFLREAVSERVAWIAGSLLAVDPSLIWATRCDWGPIALQHLLTIGGVWSLWRFHRDGRLPALGFGMFLFGLALWDKAVFAWTFTGLCAASALVFPREVAARWKAAPIAVLAFALGAYPLLRYNIAAHSKTWGETARFGVAEMKDKPVQLRTSLDGSSLYGFLVRGEGERDWNFWLLLPAALVALRWRAGRFFFCAGVVSWLFMMATRDGGGSPHHVLLLWPWPHCLIALALATLPWWRYAIVAFAVAASVAVNVSHYRLLLHGGADPPWSDAIYELREALSRDGYDRVFVDDWGILQPLRALSGGRIQLEESFGRPPAVRPGWVFVSHVDRWRVFLREPLPGELLRVVKDRQGVDVFQVFRLSP